MEAEDTLPPFFLVLLARFLFVFLILSFLESYQAYPAEKIITAEATYIMGDAESPSFAEAMALQKAKRSALEQAGTYVESYATTVGQDLTRDEIQTIAGGVLQVEVVEKRRTLVSEGMHFYIK